MWKNIIKSMCVRCKKQPATYSQYDEMGNKVARELGYEPENLCEDCKLDLLNDSADARAYGDYYHEGY